MPVYEFSCDNCGIFERMMKMDQAANPVVCPSCNAPARRIYSPPSFGGVFSGKTQELHRRIEKGAEPRLVSRKADLKPPKRSYGHVHGGRPWMIGG